MIARTELPRTLGWGLLVLVLAGAGGSGLWAWLAGGTGTSRVRSQPVLEGLGVFGSVPDFSLVERSGQRVTRADFEGRIWVANFIFTNCTETCPLQSAQMARLQADLPDRDDLRLVSITIDPERDTPAVLSEYAKRYGADPRRWLFLTGEKEAVLRLAQEGFLLSAVHLHEGTSRPGETQAIVHSSRFVVVDRHHRIRGYYSGIEPEALQRLRRDLLILLQGDQA